MRSKNTIRNIVISVLFQVFMMICGLIFPRWIILTFGSEVNGLTQTVNQAINYLNLLQAGAVGASVYALFKPVANDNYKEINEVLSATRKYFRKLGSIFILCFVAFALCFSYLTSGDGLSFYEILFASLLLGINAAFSFFVYSWFDTLFQAYQQQYVFTIGQFVERIIYYSLVVGILLYKINFIWLYVALLAGGFSRVLFLRIVYKKLHAGRIFYDYKGSTIKLNNRGALFVNQIAIQIVDGAPMIVLSFAYGLRVASVFSVYYMIYGILKTLVSTVYTSCNTSFANFTVTHNDNENAEVFDMLHYVFLMLTSCFCFCCNSLQLKFVELYTFGITDISYYQPIWSFAGVLYIAAYGIYVSYYLLTNTYGLFKEIAKYAVPVAIITLATCIALTVFNDKVFIIFAPVVYYIVMAFARYFVSRRCIPWCSKIKGQKRILFLFVMLTLSFVMKESIASLINSWAGWVMMGVVCFIITIILIILYSICFDKKNVIRIKHYMLVVLKK